MEFLETAVALFLSIGWFITGYYIGAGKNPPTADSSSKLQATSYKENETTSNEQRATNNETADAINCLVNYSSEIAYGN